MSSEATEEEQTFRAQTTSICSAYGALLDKIQCILCLKDELWNTFKFISSSSLFHTYHADPTLLV